MTYNALTLIVWFVGLVFGILICVDQYRKREFDWFFGFNLVCCVIFLIGWLSRIAQIVYS